ncbi:putative truncated ABC transporter ATP-binding protein [Brevibacillus brevis NBRC 100599]|uniref:Putative truncated ABC transporter ATP-binding protein n=1 Tax=Brevibacillus brevis (strain 47 / JCM 6285 / NBRC 100599) TaxID=358681 RepID=C0ZD99_BREBN|nr:ATP-binding cassette domain-containing protein [Brevibacillus brevis]BAH43758.1 putative truncated ABC transporter ATP-binding protein [Brevibacillus brevis NBRC 100599]
MEKASETFVEAPSVEEASEFRFDSAVHVPGSKQIIDFSLGGLQIANKQLSKQIHLSIKGREKVAIIGENGVGKTTLLKKIMDELVQHSSFKIGYIEFLDRTGNKAAITKAYTHLGNMKFTKDEMHQPIQNLSGGQKAKLLLLKMILDQCGSHENKIRDRSGILATWLTLLFEFNILTLISYETYIERAQ